MSFRFLPGDPFQFKQMKRNTVFLAEQFDRRISERTSVPSGGQYEDFVDAYLAKMEDEKNKEKTTFTRKSMLHVPLLNSNVQDILKSTSGNTNCSTF